MDETYIKVKGEWKYLYRTVEKYGKTIMTDREILCQLREDGWEIVRTRGSHLQLKHPTKPGLVTVSGKSNVDIPPGTLKSIWQ